MWLVRIAVVSLLVCPPAYGDASRDPIAGELTQLRESLTMIQGQASKELEWGTDSRRVLALYARAWKLIGMWSSHYVRQHHGLTADELADAVAELSTPDARRCLEEAYDETSPEFQDRVGSVRPRLAEYPPFSHCLGIQARALGLGRHGHAPYAIAVTFGDFGKLLMVSPAGAQVADDLQPLGSGGSMRLLPADRRGRRRFFVHTRPAADLPLGSVGCHELTILRWNGKRAERLFWRNYSTYKGESPAFDGHVVTLQTKGEIQWFSTSNQDDALDASRRIVIDPDGIRDEGLRYTNPELALVDELFRRVASGDDVSMLASPQARSMAESVVNDLTCARWCPTLGWLFARHIERGDGHTFVSLETEDVPGTFQFLIAALDGRPYIVEALHAPPTPVVCSRSKR
jgi:hypothetical protein